MAKQVNRPKIKKGNILVYLVLILGSVLMIFPFIWMISTSFKTVPETTLIPPTLLPASFSNTAAYEQVTKSLPFFNLYFNTIMMIVIRVICAVVFSSMAAYAFAKVNFPLKNLFFMIVLSQLMFPAQVFILPQYEMISALGKTDGGDEIEMLRRAIDKCGRPIVLSLSPGPAMLDKAEHLRKNANMWRITNDLWDSWDNIMEMFSRCNEWSPYVSEGCYPDCDMLPLGHISIIGCEHGVGDRMCRLSQDEQKTMMSLWCIFRSPLMLGAEMTDLDSWTLSLLTNEEVLKMHKDSRDAHQIERSFDLITWGAHDEEGSCYIALFNVTNWDETFSFDFRKAGLEGYYEVRDLWEREDLGSVDKIVTKVKSHGVKLYKLSKKQV